VHLHTQMPPLSARERRTASPKRASLPAMLEARHPSWQFANASSSGVEAAAHLWPEHKESGVAPGSEARRPPTTAPASMQGALGTACHGGEQEGEQSRAGSSRCRSQVNTRRPPDLRRGRAASVVAPTRRKRAAVTARRSARAGRRICAKHEPPPSLHRRGSMSRVGRVRGHGAEQAGCNNPGF
jgi:hypothetical protein